MRGRAHQRRATQHIVVAIAIVALTAIVLGAAVYAFLSRATLDARSCPKEGPSGHIVLLIDTTDPLTATQRRAFLELLREFGRGRVRQGELLTVFVLGESVDAASESVFEMCNPGKGDDKNIWTANPEQLRKNYEEKFLKPLTELADRLVAIKSAQTSPIMEMVQVVAINGFRRNAVQGPRRLVVVSDMLQNTTGYSHYRGDIDFAKFREAPYFQRVRVDLKEVEVELRYLMHTPAIQSRRHAKFWEDYFRDMGAALSAVGIIEG